MFYKFPHADNNIIGLIILAIILLNIKGHNKKRKADEKLYLGLIVSTSIVMILNLIMNAINGKPGYLPRQTHIFVGVIYFVLNTIPYLCWSLYVEFYIHRSVRRLKKLAPILSIQAIASIVLSIVSVFNRGIFFIDENNLYNRGHLFWLLAVLHYSYFVFTYVQIIIRRNILSKKDYYTLLSFAILPAIAGILQIMDPAKSLIWLSVSLSALIIFINIQNDEINKDYLTGLYNRRQLDRNLKNYIREIKPDDLIFMIMIDINYFKNINDTYGHIEGDEALKHTANILMDCFKSEDFISRYAGDEFVIIVKLKDEDCKEEIINRVRTKFRDFNEANITPYDISVSLGYDIYNPELKMDADDFIIHADKLMYKDKEIIKASEI